MTDPDATTRLDAEQRDEQVARLFRVLFEPGDVVEFRTLPAVKVSKKEEGRSEWMRWTGDASDLRDIVDRIEAMADRERRDIYFGVNPRREHGQRRSEHVACARCIFVEFDTASDGSEGCTKEDALLRIEEAGLPYPSAIVHSGRGPHLYWRLAEPMADLAAWKGVQKAVIRRLGSDSLIHDAPRIMRLPGLRNLKRGRMAVLLDADPARIYDIEEFAYFVEEAAREEERMRQRVASVEVKAGGMSKMTRRLVEEGVLLPGGGRRHSIFTAACDLQSRGWSEQAAADLLLPAGRKLDLSKDEVADLPRQIRNAFAKPREPYAFDPPPAGQQEEEEQKRRLPTLDEQLQAFKQYRASNTGRTLVGLETGFRRLDQQLSGLSGLSILAAAPGAGKTSLTLQLGLQTLLRNPSCCFIFMSCEMMAMDIAGRLLTMKTSMDLRRLSLPGLTRSGIDEMRGKADDEVIEQAIDDLREVSPRIRLVPPELIIEGSDRGDMAGWMQRRVMEVMDETGSSEVVIVIDNLQQAPVRSTRDGGDFKSDIERDRFAIESMMRLQHNLAQQATRSATIVVSEVNKASMQQGSVNMTAVIGSVGSIYRADSVWIMAQAERRGRKSGNSYGTVDLFAPHSDDPAAADFNRRCVDLVIQKARAPGDKGRLLFAFDHRLHRMEEIAESTAVRVERDGDDEVDVSELLAGHDEARQRSKPKQTREPKVPLVMTSTPSTAPILTSQAEQP